MQLEREEAKNREHDICIKYRFDKLLSIVDFAAYSRLLARSHQHTIIHLAYMIMHVYKFNTKLE